MTTISHRLSKLSQRRAEARALARARVASWSRVPMSPTTRATSWRPRMDLLIVLLGGSVLLHASVIVVRWLTPVEKERVVLPAKIEIVEPPPKVDEPPPPPPEPEPVASAPPPPPEPKKLKPKIVEETPPPPSAPPPRRVVGLSMESTSEGGSGPAFATGNTTAGETARTATDPRDIPRGPAPPVDTPAPPSPAPNRAASNIPGLGGAIKPPVRRGEVKPRYPELLRAQGIEADVKLLIRVDANGRVIDVRIVAASAYPELDASAVEAVRAGSYEPAVRDGVAVAYSLNFTVRFRLDQP